ncbi:hypothetical protein G6F59_017125 [Rhizopus arrhizus]|nr:hypothetical protein G6F59_017125 [Rhizopus arrhizus]
MDGRHRAVVAGVHRLQHFQHLGATDFADHDAVRPHAQAVAPPVADAHCAMAFGAAQAFAVAPKTGYAPGCEPHPSCPFGNSGKPGQVLCCDPL